MSSDGGPFPRRAPGEQADLAPAGRSSSRRDGRHDCLPSALTPRRQRAARSLTGPVPQGGRTTGDRVRRLALLVVNNARWVIVGRGAVRRRRGDPRARRRRQSVARAVSRIPSSESVTTAEGSPGRVPGRGRARLRRARHGARRHRSTIAAVTEAGHSAHRAAGGRSGGDRSGRRTGRSRRRRRQEHRRPPGAHDRDARWRARRTGRDREAALARAHTAHRSVATEVTGLSEVARQVSERSEKDVQRVGDHHHADHGDRAACSCSAASSPLGSRSAIGVIAVVGTLLALHAHRVGRPRSRSSP